MKITLKNLTIILLTTVLISCESDEQLGLNIQPPSDLLGLNHSDTIGITAYTVKETNSRSDETAQSLAGYYTDPIFGKVSASFCTQIRMGEENVDFGSNPIIDSVILSMEYYSSYAKNSTLNQMTFNVYKLNSPLYIDSTYYSSRPIDKGELIGNKTFIPAPNDSVMVGNTMKKPQLRIPLYNSLGNFFLTAAASGVLTNNTTFLEYFNGICIEPVVGSNNGDIISFDMLSSNSCVTIYYHNGSESSNYIFNIEQSCARYNHFDHYNFAEAESNFLQQINGDKTLGDDKLYLQALSGCKIFIKIPDLTYLTNNNNQTIVVNRAILLLPTDQNDNTEATYNKPTSLGLSMNTAKGTQFLPDQIYAEAGFGGYYNETNKCYEFTVTRYIQKLIDGEIENLGLNAVVSGASIRANRVILNGPKSLTPLRLDLTYSIVK